MSEIWDNFLKSFIPLFVALDVLGVLPLYARFAMGLDEKDRSRVLRESIVTAFLVTLGFVAIGDKILEYLGITITDLLIAGGVILFIIAAKDLTMGRGDLVGQEELFAVVPLGIPLLAGPAVLTTSLLIYNAFGFMYVLVALVLNLLLAWTIFKYSLVIIRLISRRWVEALSKFFVLLLAAIAIMFIRRGIEGYISPLP